MRAEKTAWGGSDDPLFVRHSLGRGGLFFNQIVMKTEIMIPIRTAEQQFAVAAANSCLLRILKANGLHEVDGVGGKCLMEPAEYEQYKRICATWADVGSDQHDAPGPLMFIVGSKAEVDEIAEKRLKPRSHFAASFREIEQLLLSYNHSLSEEDRDEMMLTLCAKILPLREAVLRAEEIWSEQTLHSEIRHLEDIEKLSLINENDWLKLENERLKNELNKGGDVA